MFLRSLGTGTSVGHQCLGRFVSTTTALNGKNNNLARQSKIISKLYGERVAGSKKRWYPAHDSSSAHSVTFKASNFGKSSSKTAGGGKETTRRMTVLNKLFMQHITDMLATGEVSEKILGRGLQVTRVKISNDFAHVNVYWHGSGSGQADAELEQELCRCSGLLRHELSQLELMGVVPRIRFVRDKSSFSLNQIEAILNNLDLRSEESDDEFELPTEKRLDDFFGNSSTTPDSRQEDTLLNMRHNVFGLDHREISVKIHSKMRKSKQAWDLHNQHAGAEISVQEDIVEKSKKKPMPIETKDFNAFLAKRRTTKVVPERKNSRVEEVWLEPPEYNDDNLALSSRQRRLYEEEDYIDDEIVKK